MSPKLNAQGEPGWGAKIAYVAASMAGGAFNMIFTAMLMIYYSPPGGSERSELLPITITGLVLGFGRLIDAFSDPVVAYYSDKTKSRLGRRIPWILAGLPFLFIFFVGMWAVPASLRTTTPKNVSTLTRGERLDCRAKINHLRGDENNPKAGWVAKAESKSWYKKCQLLVNEAQADTERKLCLKEMETYKSEVRENGKDWQKLVPKDSACKAYGKGCPLFPKSQEAAKIKDEGAKGKGNLWALLAQNWKVALWLAVMSSGFWLAYTVVFVPHLSLMPTIARTAQSRMSINLLMAIANILGILLLQELMRKEVFIKVLGYADMSIPYFATVGLIAVILIGLTPLFIREPVHEYKDEHHYGMAQAIKWSFTNKAFVVYTVSTLFLMVGFNGVLGSVEYVVPLLLHREASQMMIQVYGIIMGSIIFFFAIMLKLSQMMDKRIIYGASLFIMAAVIPLMYLLGEQTVMGIDTIWFARIIFFLIGMPVAGVMSLQRTVVADIIDDDEIKTGLRREAMFFGSEGLITKMVSAIVPFLQSKLFDGFGYCHPSHLSHFGVRYLGPATAVFVVVGAFIFMAYPIRESELRARREKYLAEKGGYSESSDDG